MQVCPCFGCEDRKAGCHAGCDKYTGWKAAHDAEKDERYRRELPEIMTTTYKVNTAIRNKKRLRRDKK